jgi:hypothetical protein
MKKYLFIANLLLLFSCKNITILENEKEDISDADKKTVLFYEYFSKKDIDSIYDMTDKSLDKMDIYNVVYGKDSLFGKLINVDITEIKTVFNKVDRESSTTYTVNTNVEYEKGKQSERLVFFKLNNENIILKTYE